MYSIAWSLKKFRENSGYTQQQMADALNIDRSTYAYYETGKTNPSLSTLMKIKDILNVSLEDLLESEPKKKRFFDVAEDLESFDRVYELNKKEKSLVSLYRSFSPDEQDKILENVSKEKKNKKIFQNRFNQSMNNQNKIKINYLHSIHQLYQIL